MQTPALYHQCTTYAWSHAPWIRCVEITDMRGPRPLPHSVDTLGMGVLAVLPLHMHGAHSVNTQHGATSLFAHVQPFALYRQYTTYAWSHTRWPRRVEVIVMRGPRPLPYSVCTLGMGVTAI